MSTSPIFCTVFDKNYLFQGVTLYTSLASAMDDFKLYCLALDQVSVDTLQKLYLKNLKVISLDDLPQDLVQQIRTKANYGQFCWAMQPLICRKVLDLGQPHVTYIEADAYFYSSVSPLLDELKNASASVAPHWYSPENLFLEPIAGKYCTHFNFFRNDEAGLNILEYWRTLCFQYQKEKPLLYPGQKGLDDWTLRFKEVHELQNRGAGIAPWNVSQFDISKTKPIFYHFHQLVRYQDGTFELGHYPMSKDVLTFFYIPYVNALLDAEALVQSKVPNFKHRRELAMPGSILQALIKLNYAEIKKATQPFRRKLKGTYNVYPESFFREHHA